ncbi:leukocyte immunoglobulin-like receptor subfamily B member 2 isoform X2 [Anguilla anguilla]|uniref:leukocyte immunoglobulin-like receptor subfamily B member 2 isoform X2 n=1 Tax=Anguilla anguilla TaxID=7936 RepID=UPI0015A7F5F1|nr:leukocyte immunoglobulin-like receptor subfamily B member 2 isoform X2 [Anguilla anguilla]
MAVCAHHCSVKDFVLLVSSILLLCDLVCLADPRPSDLPAPSLTRQTPQGGGAIDLVCRAPDGHAGVLFRLVRVTAQGDKVDLVEFPQERQEARFSLRGEAGLSQESHCCMYQDRHQRYSGYSPYIRLSDPAPASPLLQPSLSVEPHGGRVVSGQSLSFHCSAPPSQSPAPQAFFLLRTGAESEGSVVSPASPDPLGLEASFHVGPMRGGEGGSYTCVYRVVLPGGGHANSIASAPVHITVSELLPRPTLSLLDPDPGDQGVTVRCTGPQAYPGAQFTLFRLGSLLPVSSRPADHTRHEVYFTLPVLRPDPDPDPDPEQYQCQYSVLLGQHWSESERSLPITVPSPTGTNFIPAEVSPPPSPSPFSAPDWRLIAGCVSAVLLFLVLLIGLGIGVHRTVKALAEKKKRREEDRFWKPHAMDHTLDLTLRPISIGSQVTSSTFISLSLSLSLKFKFKFKFKFKCLYWHDVTLYILPKQVFEH